MGKMNENGPVELALIGYSQAGKTTLAVGLYATSSADFTVTGDGEDTELYLRSRKAMLESGQWLDSTQERDRPDLTLNIMRAGKRPAKIRFKEYMGELACNSESYKRDVIGKPKGAIILLNPKMDALQDVVSRVEMLAQLREIVNYLSQVKCGYVALVTTAADLLEGLDSAFRETFEAWKEEIVNALKTSTYVEGKTWKEFSVTVSGKLEDVNRPRIARGDANTSRLPFVWIIDQMEAAAMQSRKRGLMMRTAVAACSAGLIGATSFLGWYFGIDRQTERKMLTAAAAPVASLEKAIEKSEMSGVNSACQEIESVVQTAASKGAYFRGNRERLATQSTNLLLSVERGRMVWYPSRLEDWGKRARDLASEESCAKWRLQICGWKPLTEDGQSLKQSTLKSFDENVKGWRMLYEGRIFEEDSSALLDGLKSFRCENDFEKILRDLLKKCQQYEELSENENKSPLVPLEIRKKVWNAAYELRARCLREMVDNRLSEFKPENAEPPVLNDAVRTYLDGFVKGILSPADMVTFYKMVDTRIETRLEEWKSFQNDACREYIAKWKDKGDAYGAVKDYVDFNAEHYKAPMLTSVVKCLHETVGKAFLKNVNELRSGTCASLTGNFTSINELAQALVRVKCPLVKQSCWYKFADDCCTKGNIRKGGIRGAFPRTYTVSSIDASWTARSLYSPSGQALYLGIDMNGESASVSPTLWVGSEDWHVVWSGRLTVAGNHWNQPKLTISGKTDDKGRGTWTTVVEKGKTGAFPIYLGTERLEEWNLTGDNTDVTVSLRAAVNVEGACIWDYLPNDTRLELK